MGLSRFMGAVLCVGGGVFCPGSRMHGDPQGLGASKIDLGRNWRRKVARWSFERANC